MIVGHESEVIKNEVKQVLYMNDSRTSFANSIQGLTNTPGGVSKIDQTWLIGTCSVPSIKRRRVGIVRLSYPANFGSHAESVQFVVLVVTPTVTKPTKSANEVGRAIATLLSNPETKASLNQAIDRRSFIHHLRSKAIDMATSAKDPLLPAGEKYWSFLGDLFENFTRRAKYYPSDFWDGVSDGRAIQQTLSTTFFLYFSVIFPTLAFGALNDKNTNGKSNANRALLGEIDIS